MKRTWTDEQSNLLRKIYPTSTPSELAELFPDKTPEAIKSKATKLGLKKANPRFKFTPEQIEVVREIYPNTLSADIAALFGCTIYAVHNLAHRLSLKKDIEFIRETAAKNMADPDHPGRKHHFKKGNISFNKGRKQSEFLSPEAIERTKATRFKKGQKGWNYKLVGYERVNVDGYVEVKVKESRTFRLKHRIVWEQHNGPLQKGENVQFRDGNRLNCDIDNLYLIRREDQMLRNSGALNLPDGMVAKYLAGSHSSYDPALMEELLNHPELLELKRQQILLNRNIKKHERQNSDTRKDDR